MNEKELDYSQIGHCQNSRSCHCDLGCAATSRICYLTRSLKRWWPWPADRCLQASYHHDASEPYAPLFKKVENGIPPPPPSSMCSKREGTARLRCPRCTVSG